MSNRREDDSSWGNFNPRISPLWWLWIGLAGGFGGTATNLFRFGSQMTDGHPFPEASYFIGVLIFGLMGGGLALSFRESDIKKAFFLGLSLPAMFQNVANDVSSHAVEAAGFAPPALLEEAPPRELVLLEPPADGHPAFVMRFLSPDGKRREEQSVDEHGPSTELEELRLEVPTWADRAELVYGTSRSDPVTLSKEPESRFTVVATRARWSGIKISAGISGVAEWEIELVPYEEER